MNKTVQTALHRKKISQAYHTQMPVFLKSEGPFAMYDHSLRHMKPTQSANRMTVVDQASVAALQRYEKELVQLKELREKEKAQFIHNIELSKWKAREALNERAANTR